MKIALISTYELGHQPLHVASPAAALEAAGHEVRLLDISVEPWDPEFAGWADAVAFSVPMHTAMRIALEGAEAVKQVRPSLPVCVYGLYAGAASSPFVDRTIAGEYEAELARWASGLDGADLDLTRGRFRLPVRSGLPTLDRYARLAVDGEERTAGYVEASHGCAHRCRHCPVPVVYDGRTRRVDASLVLEDIAQHVEAGAQHITFGDPDFLNRWAHSMKITEMLHDAFPEITFDITAKVSHLLRYESLVPLLASQGCLFVVSAFECVNDEILGYLDKGHTASEASRVIELLRANGVEPRPSWLPFMPWTTVCDVADILDFVVDHDLVGNVDPVQYTIRLLIPKGSLMLQVPELAPYLGVFDDASLSYEWTAADPPTVALQQRIASLVEESQTAGATIAEIFCDVRDVVGDALGRTDGDRSRILASSYEGKPRLTEPWFCCAEPTKDQFGTFQRKEPVS